MRRWFLARHPLCAHCLKRGFTTPATEVDHIKPLRQGGARLDQTNLQSLCKPCHSRKTRQEVRESNVGEGGLNLYRLRERRPSRYCHVFCAQLA